MTTRYVGKGGSDSNNGLSWATRKLTLNGVEDTPVEAGDTVYVGAGTYRESLTVDVSGSSGSPITYIGDYDGSHTDGTGGVVRVTGSDDDIATARNTCISADAKDFRTFTGFVFDLSGTRLIELKSCTDTTINKCYFYGLVGFYQSGAGQLRTTITNSYFLSSGENIYFIHTSAVDNSAHVISNCIFVGSGKNSSYGLRIDRVGGITAKNCLFTGLEHAMRNVYNLTAGQVNTTINSIIDRCNTPLYSNVLGWVVENYNSFYGCATNRTNVDIGAQSNTYPPLFDARWFFEMVNGGSMVTPFDLASYSKLINLAGTSPTTTDMRGTAKIGDQREWGALEYDPSLDIEAGSGGGGLLTNPGMTGGMRG